MGKFNLSHFTAGLIVIVSGVLSYTIANKGANYDTLELSALLPFYVLPILNIIIIISFNVLWDNKKNNFVLFIFTISLLLILGVIARLSTVQSIPIDI